MNKLSAVGEYSWYGSCLDAIKGAFRKRVAYDQSQIVVFPIEWQKMTSVLRPWLILSCLIITTGCGSSGSGGPSGDLGVLIAPDVRLTTVVNDLANGALDPAAPGRGLTDYPVDIEYDIPKAYAMIVKAAELDAGRTLTLSALSRTSESWLVAHDDEDGDGVKGWGLPFEWDAFGDGTPNAANTEYAITTAIVIDALLDRADTMTGPQRVATLDLAWQAISSYLDPTVATPGGMAPYSLTPQDRGWDVFNTAAYLAAMAQRLSRMENDVDRVTRLELFADTAMQVFLDRRLVTREGAWYWPYLLPGSSVNDLPHAAYIIYGIETYVREGGRLADSFPRDRIWSHLKDFVPSDVGYMRAYPYFVETSAIARAYDVGFALATLCLFGDPLPNVREQLTAVLSNYRVDSGHYAKLPVRGPKVLTDPPLIVTEYETYFLFAASACLAAQRQ